MKDDDGKGGVGYDDTLIIIESDENVATRLEKMMKEREREKFFFSSSLSKCKSSSSCIITNIDDLPTTVTNGQLIIIRISDL